MTKPARFFHFTQARHINNILEEGLKPFPEGDGEGSLWECCDPLMNFPPDKAVWLTEQKTPPEYFGRGRVCDYVRITVGLPRNNRRLHHWPTWLRKHEPNMLAQLISGEVEEDGWREHWFYEGTIAPSQFEAIDFDFW